MTPDGGEGPGAAVSASRVLVVSREAQGSRLDRYVALALARDGVTASRADVQRWIAHGRVLVDGKPRKAADKVSEGARVEVSPEAAPRTLATPDAAVQFRIVYQDDDLVVVDKPAGLVVHPAKGHTSGTLVNGLLARGLFDAFAGAGEATAGDDDARAEEGGYARPGIVHRIDRGTSGLLVVARTPAARESLKAQLAAHTVVREYEAIAVGEVTVVRHATLYGRHPTDRKRFSGRVRAGKHAVTHVRVIERIGAIATLIVCALETGRTHQIRVHLSESGTPILGDVTYGKPPRDPRVRAMGEALGHQALHARLLGFVHPRTGAPMRFESGRPEDVERALEGLRGIESGSRAGQRTSDRDPALSAPAPSSSSETPPTARSRTRAPRR